MAKTNLMRADEIAAGFNGTTDRRYWKASIAGTRTQPEVNFNSRASMVRVTYRIVQADFTISFAKSSAAFGDFLASAHRSLTQVVANLVAAGLPFTLPEEDNAVLRLEYSRGDKRAVVHMARCSDDWRNIEPAAFKVPKRKTEENVFSGIDL